MGAIDAGAHYDLTNGSPLTCRTCKGEQTIEQTERDPLMYLYDGPDATSDDEAECEACQEARETWPQECALSAWEEAQR